MNWQDLVTTLLEGSRSATGLAVNWLIQSTLLIVCGLVVGHWLRGRGSAVQSAIYRTTLVAVIVCPLATTVLSLSGASGWSLQMPPAYSVGESPLSVGPEAPGASVPFVETAIDSDSGNDRSTASLSIEAAPDVQLSAASPTEKNIRDLAPLSADARPTLPAIATADADPMFSLNIFGIAAAAMAAVWFAASAWFCGRLFASWRNLGRLRRAGRTAEPQTIETCRQIANRFNVTPPEVLHSPYLPSPCLAGLRHPAVMLPETELSLPVRDVLVHELAHLARRDCFWNLLRQVATALLFFQPLLWKLSRRLAATAEEVCDDYVVQFGGDRREYAHRLVDIATLTLPPMATAGVGIVSFRSMLAARVSRIMDTSRSLSTRVGSLLLAIMLAAGLAATLLVGLVGLNPAPLVADAAPSSEKNDSEGDRVKTDDNGSTRPLSDENAPDDASGEIEASAGDERTVRGHVIGPDGKPVSGATVFAAWTFGGNGWPRLQRGPSHEFEHIIVGQTKSAADGAFELTFSTKSPREFLEKDGWSIAAAAPGMGPAWKGAATVIKEETTTFRLTRDLPIRGRVVDLEGKPIKGVRVSLRLLRPAKDEKSVVEWIADAKKKSVSADLDSFLMYSTSAGKSNGDVPPRFPGDRNDGGMGHGSPALPADTQTDEDGRFQFSNLGENRLAMVEFDGPTIAKSDVHVLTRDVEKFNATPTSYTGVHAATYYGREFEFVAEPTQPIEGTVKDADTGEPLVNVLVRLNRFAGNLFSQQDFLSAYTDEQGNYKLLGAPQGGGHAIEAAPSSDTPYFPTEKKLDQVAASFDMIRHDFKLKRGNWISGRVTEGPSGKPIAEVMVDYLPLRSNEYAKDYSNYDPRISGSAPSYRYHTDSGGRFRVLAIPGAGILGAIVQAKNDDQEPYVTSSAGDLPKHLVGDNGQLNSYHPWIVTGYNALRDVDLSDGNDEDAKYDLELSRGLKRRINLVDASGQPVTGVQVLGRTFPEARLEEPLKEPNVELIGLRKADDRVLVLLHPEKRIGTAMLVGPGDDLRVELQPCAVARARLVSEDGEAFADAVVNVSISGSDMWGRSLTGTTSDKDGRFEVHLPPGMRYHISHYRPTSGVTMSAECVATPGAVFELGDLATGTKLKTEQTAKMLVAATESGDSDAEDSVSNTIPKTGRGPVQVEFVEGLDVIMLRGSERNVQRVLEIINQNEQLSAASDADQNAAAQARTVVRGRVIGSDGKPVAGAKVAAIGSSSRVARGGDLGYGDEILAETATDEEGNYELVASGVSSKTYYRVALIASAPGAALTWRQFDPNAKEVDAPFELKAEEVVRGRLVDIEGRPASGVRMTVSSVMTRVKDGSMPNAAGVGYRNTEQVPAAWPAAVVTDDAGRFTIRNAGPANGMFVEVAANDRFAPQTLAINTGMSEQRGERDGTYRPQVVTNLKPNEEAVIPLAPAQIFEGEVTYADTGKPAPHARLTIWASQQKFGSMISIAGKADANGHFRLSPYPGIRFGITAYPPDGTAYLARQMDAIGWEDAQTRKETNVTLPRGVLVRGKIVESKNGKPVAGATIQYVPESDHNPNAKDDILTGWQGILLSNEAGDFEIAVLPGPGHLLVHGPIGQFVLKETSDRELRRGKPGGRRNYAHAIERFDPKPDAEAVELAIELELGATVSGTLVDDKGQPALEVLLISQLNVHPTTLHWRGDASVQIRNGQFEFRGMAADERYQVHFLNAKNRTGATVALSANDEPPVVKMLPCVQAVARFVNSSGQPVSGYRPSVHMVITPGADPYDFKAAERNELASDSDFVANIDRSNGWNKIVTDADGRVTLPALIPGATYRIQRSENGNLVSAKDFTVQGSSEIDLGEIVVEEPK